MPIGKSSLCLCTCQRSVCKLQSLCTWYRCELEVRGSRRTCSFLLCSFFCPLRINPKVFCEKVQRFYRYPDGRCEPRTLLWASLGQPARLRAGSGGFWVTWLLLLAAAEIVSIIKMLGWEGTLGGHLVQLTALRQKSRIIILMSTALISNQSLHWQGGYSMATACGSLCSALLPPAVGSQGRVLFQLIQAFSMW